MSGELVTLEDDDQVLDVELDDYNILVQYGIHFGTTADWEAQPTMVGEAGHIYVYTDYAYIDEEDVPAIKVGDGVTLLSDLPFVSGNNDILNAHIGNAAIHVTAAEKESWNAKVSPEEGKGLSTNDFTNELKAKLEGIEAGAEANVQANWDQTVTTADDFIKNKPTIPENTSDLVNDSGYITADLAPVQGVKGSAESAYRKGSVSISKENIGLGNVDNTSDADKPISTAVQAALDGKVDKEADKSLSSNDFTTAEKEKLAGIAAGAEENVQANWNESDQTSDAFIQNKPSIPSKTSDLTNDSGFVTDAAMQSALDQKVDKVAGKGLSTNDFTTADKDKLAGIAAGAEVNVQSDWNEADTDADDFIKNKPTIPTKVSQLQNDSGFITGISFAGVAGDPEDNANLKQALDQIDANAGHVEAGTTATKNYVAGEYVIVNRVLYKTTTTIASGETFAVGTNISADNLGDELSAVQAFLDGVATDATGQLLLTQEQIETSAIRGILNFLGIFFDETNYKFDNMPSDEKGLEIVDELKRENVLLDQLYYYYSQTINN